MTAVSPFKPRARSISPRQPVHRPGSPTQHASPHRAASNRPQLQRHLQQQQQQRLLWHQPPAANDVMPSWQQKLQADFDRYKRVGQQSMSATVRQKPLAYRQQSMEDSQGMQANYSFSPGSKRSAQDADRYGGSGGRSQAQQSMDRQRRLAHQRTVDVVPRLDSLGYGAPAKQPLPVREGTLGRRGQSSRASAPPWTAGGHSNRRLSPSRFAEREQEPLLASGFARSQRIGAMH